MKSSVRAPARHAVAVFLVLIAAAWVGAILLYMGHPPWRSPLIAEGGWTERMTAATLVVAVSLAVVRLTRCPRGTRSALGILAAVAAVFLLDEVSFGLPWLGREHVLIGGEPIDGLHDVLNFLGSRWYQKLLGLLAAGLVLRAVLAVPAVARRRWPRRLLAALRRPAHLRFAVPVAGLAVLTLTIDAFDEQLAQRTLFGVPQVLQLVEEASEAAVACLLLVWIATTPPGRRAGDAAETGARRVPDAASPTRRRVAVVVPAHNAADTLDRCLRALVAAVPPPAQIVVADDASAPPVDPAQIAALCGPVPWRVVRTGDAAWGPARARNAAAAAADPSADTLAFVDADVLVRPDTLKKLTRVLRGGVAAAFGSYDDDPEAPAVASLYANLRHHQTHQDGDGPAETFWSGCGVIDRAAFDAAGGFAAAYGRPSIEDIELGGRLRSAGQGIALVADAQCRHLKAWTLRSLWRTDVYQRALPWARLLTRPGAARPLNARPGEHVAALGAGVAALGGGLAGVAAAAGSGRGAALGVAAAMAGLAAVAALNRRLLGKLRQRGGLTAAAGGLGLHTLYYLYSGAALVGTGVARRWGFLHDGDPSNRPGVAARLLTTAGVLTLASSAVACAVLWGFQPDTLTARLASAGADPGSSRYDAAAVAGVQTRAACAAAGYALAALGLAAAGATPLHAAGVRLRRRVHRLVRATPRGHGLALAVATLGFALHSGVYLGQPLRTDEGVSLAEYAAFNPLQPLTQYHSTNNHVLHSVMLQASVAVLGPHPAAARLPAWLLAVAGVPLLYAAGRSLPPCRAGGRRGVARVALCAALLYAALPHGLDLATNARGYPLINAALLALLMVLPDVGRGRRGAGVLAALLGAVGAWAVPVMAYPFAGIVVAVALWPGRRRSAAVHSAAALGVLTTLGVALLYGPAIVATPPGGLGITHTVEVVREEGRGALGGVWTHNLEVAAKQWGRSAWPLLVGVAGAGGVLLLRNPRTRRLVIAAALGPAAVAVATGGAPLPWWSMSFAYPVVLLGAAVALGRGAAGRRGRRAGAPPAVLAGLAVGLGAAAAALVGYPAPGPGYVGFPPAPAVAGALRALDAHGSASGPLTVVAHPVVRGALLGHLAAHPLQYRVVASFRDVDPAARGRVVRVLSADEVLESPPPSPDEQVIAVGGSQMRVGPER